MDLSAWWLNQLTLTICSCYMRRKWRAIGVRPFVVNDSIIWAKPNEKKFVSGFNSDKAYGDYLDSTMTAMGFLDLNGAIGVNACLFSAAAFLLVNVSPNLSLDWLRLYIKVTPFRVFVYSCDWRFACGRFKFGQIKCLLSSFLCGCAIFVRLHGMVPWCHRHGMPTWQPVCSPWTLPRVTGIQRHRQCSAVEESSWTSR